jgi:CRP-like cAMP-binding protein
MMRHLAGNYAASLLRITALEQAKARDKLLYTLYYLCCRYGKQVAKRVEIGISLTHQNLAALTGLTRETAATEMNRLKNCKLLTYDHQTYRVNMDALLDALGEDSFSGIKNINTI